MMRQPRYGFWGVFLTLMFASACPETESGTTQSADAVAQVETGADETVDTGTDSASSPCTKLNDGSPCDDEDPCTVDDVCESGVCVGGSNKVCDALGACQAGTCDPSTGECLYTQSSDGTPCQVACYSEAYCAAGACQPEGEQTPCPSPDDPCVDELKCNTATGQCDIPVRKLEGESCDTDDSLCTIETCDAQGACVEEGVETCESLSVDNPCWTFLCKPTQGCVQGSFLEGNSCNDGNACTTGDKCTVDDPTKKLCKGTPVNTDDLNPCTDDACVGGTIEHTIIVGLGCTLAEDHPCGGAGVCSEAGVCQSATGCECAIDSDCPTPENLCTGPLVCDTSGSVPVCVPDPDNAIQCPAASGPCKQQVCEPATGNCFEMDAPDGTPCDDENACTLQDACSAGVCVGPQALACDDTLFCNGLEQCDPSTGCVAGTAPDIDDDVPCTIDACDEVADAVTHTPDNAFCSDDNVCDGIEVCDVQLGCQEGTPPAVDDGVACTIDACDPVSGVSHTIDPTFCGDNNVCNGGEVCDPEQGGCVTTPAPVIDDGIACTIDACDPITGVSHVADNSLCEDNNVCNGIRICDPAQGCVLSVPAPQVSDQIPCTVDSCDPITGVSNVPDDSLCSNQNVCDGIEFCDVGGGGCASGTPLVVDDGIDCTEDSCDPVNGVIRVPVDAECDDLNACDGVETCVVGLGCQAGTPPTCDDGNACNGVETCDAVDGCVDGTAPTCDDGDACNGVETCDAVEGCLAGTPVQCDDGLFCNGAETCQSPGGGCVDGPSPGDDGIACTLDLCDEETDTVLNPDACEAPQVCNSTSGLCEGGAGGTCTDPLTEGTWFGYHSYPGSGPVGVNQFFAVEEVATRFDQSSLSFPLTITHLRLYTASGFTYQVDIRSDVGQPGGVVPGSITTISGTGGFDVHQLATPVTYATPQSFWVTMSGTTNYWFAYGDGDGEVTSNSVASCISFDGVTCLLGAPTWSSLAGLGSPFSTMGDLIISIGTCE